MDQDHLRAEILWDHLDGLSTGSNGVSQEISERMAYASSLSLLESNDENESGSSKSIGGITSNDVARYGVQRTKLSRGTTEALTESLDNTLNEIASYYYAGEELDSEELRSRALKIDEDIKADLVGGKSDVTELMSQLETVLGLYQDAVEVHPRLQASLEDALQRLPPLLNANQAASNDLLAVTIEASLLKLSVVRARMQASLYGYTSSSNPNATMTRAIDNLHEKLTAQERALDAQKDDIQTRLQEYQELLELVDGHGGGFAQVVEDLATVRRETEDCRKDLRRLGWTEK